ncbi:hypothetical protein, partial [Escherichia coli]|uniref:hypothetical protein n=1 Tax=Escherichia coli TaxID=562 RepID=UPI001BE41C72
PASGRPERALASQPWQWRAAQSTWRGGGEKASKDRRNQALRRMSITPPATTHRAASASTPIAAEAFPYA